MIEQLETRYGTMFIPDTDNGQYWWLKTTGAYAEDELIELCCDILGEGPKGTVIDAGANFGCWSLPLARYADKVLAFEPQRCVRDLLKRTVASNPGLNIEIFEYALGAEKGFTTAPDISLDNSTNFGGVALGYPHSEHPEAMMYQVPVRALDDIVPDVPITFIKADVEGGELGLLKGAVKLITKWKPFMLVEAEHPNTDTQELGRFIESLGYNVEVAIDNNFLAMPV